MKYIDITPTMRAFLGGREALRKLGFEAEDIYCMVARSGRKHGFLSGFVTLRAQDKEFNIELGYVDDAEKFQAEYAVVSEAVNNHEVSQEDLERIWRESEAFANPAGLIGALMNKGFRIPKERRTN